ncbi:helix-turn-helix transcriptional regulator [Ktedonobacteria bacterium brp13]|nr:helix-turn-helix transcriptional regulator [Ktedonobacteria bacterium brp13]
MSVHVPRIRTSSPLALVVKEHRDKFALTQEQLAADLNVDVRTLRRWESGETVLNDMRELRRIAMLLGVAPERLGIANAAYSALTIEHIDETMQYIWNLIDLARGYEAVALVERLVNDLGTQLTCEDPAILRKLAETLHLAGYVKSMVTRANEASAPLHYYREMEKVARILQDDTLLNIALTYEGDMHSRNGALDKAITYLEAARDTTPNADSAARGNGIQLLGRAYLRAQRLSDFEQAMQQAEELSYLVNPQSSSTRGQYSLGTVYEEYGRSYIHLGQTQQALDYLDLAEAHLSRTMHWRILIMTARAMALVHDGDFKSGVNLAVESAQLCRDHGTIRLMERIYGVQHYLEQLTREIGQVGAVLRDTLDGPIEY